MSDGAFSSSVVMTAREERESPLPTPAISLHKKRWLETQNASMATPPETFRLSIIFWFSSSAFKVVVFSDTVNFRVKTLCCHVNYFGSRMLAREIA